MKARVPFLEASGLVKVICGGRVAFWFGVTEMLKLSTTEKSRYCTVVPLIQLRTSWTDDELYGPIV